MGLRDCDEIKEDIKDLFGCLGWTLLFAWFAVFFNSCVRLNDPTTRWFDSTYKYDNIVFWGTLLIVFVVYIIEKIDDYIQNSKKK